MSDAIETIKSLTQAPLELRAILENATVGILFSRNRAVLMANPLCARMFGYTPDEFIGLPGQVLYPSDEAYDEIGRDAGPQLAAGQSFRTELQMRRKDGSLFWCRVSAKAVDAQRTQDGTLWIMEDITTDRVMLEALEQSARELGGIFETATAGIIVLRNRRFIRCNRRFEELLGCSPGELIGKSTRLLYASDADYEDVGMRAYAEISQGEVHRRVQKFQRRDGTEFWGNFSGCAFDPQNPHSGSVWLLEDITQEREQEELVRRALAEQEMIFENAAVGILFVRNRHVQRCNRRLEEIFGWEPGELAGQTTRVFFASEDDYLEVGALAYDAILRDRATISTSSGFSRTSPNAARRRML
jgi:PAS domain S-box-containing protein